MVSVCEEIGERGRKVSQGGTSESSNHLVLHVKMTQGKTQKTGPVGLLRVEKRKQQGPGLC